MSIPCAVLARSLRGPCAGSLRGLFVLLARSLRGGLVPPLYFRAFLAPCAGLVFLARGLARALRGLARGPFGAGVYQKSTKIN